MRALCWCLAVECVVCAPDAMPNVVATRRCNVQRGIQPCSVPCRNACGARMRACMLWTVSCGLWADGTADGCAGDVWPVAAETLRTVADRLRSVGIGHRCGIRKL